MSLYLQLLHFDDLVPDSFLQGSQDPQLSVYRDLHLCDSLTNSLGQVEEVVVITWRKKSGCISMN